jgi:hypothetical protein
MFRILCRIIFVITVVCLTQEHAFSQSQKKNARLLPKLIKKEKKHDGILDKADDCGVQIIYTQIKRKNNTVSFIDYHYNIGGNKYFYPSTAVFLPVATLTLEKISELSKECDLDKNRCVKFNDPVTQETIAYRDTLPANDITFAYLIKKMFVSVDEYSYNFCYDFLNQRYLNERMHRLGYLNSWFLHKLDNNAPESSRYSNTVTFFRTDVQSSYIDIIYLKRHPTTVPFYSVYVKKGEYNPDDYYAGRTKVFLGKGFVKNGKIVDSAADYTFRNKFTIENMHDFLKALIFPDMYKNKPNLSDDDYALLYKYMSENNDRNYILNDRLNDSSIKIFNNSGKGAGFMIDNAYVIDMKNGVDFFITVVIKCNSADILGEDYYEYEKMGLPSMRTISRIIHEHAISEKENIVDFGDFLRKIK